MALSGCKLSDVPPPLQVKVISLHAPPLLRSLESSLYSSTQLSGELPNDLLNVANTCRDLRKVVAEVLGARAQILNAATAKPMWQWISALSDSVNAVSFHSAFELSRQIKGALELIDRDVLAYSSSLNILRSLSDHQIRLQVLDVTSAPFHFYTRPEDSASLLHAFKKTLQTCSSSLRELAIRVTPICINAVSQVTLPHLEVVWLRIIDLDYEPMEEFFESSAEEKEKFAYQFLHAMRALEGHADRKANKTTIRELHILYVFKTPCIHNDNTCKGLFESVQVLRLGALDIGEDKGDDFAKFVTLFPNLRSLCWLGPAMARNLSKIFASCPMLEDLYPVHYPQLKLSNWIKFAGPNCNSFRDSCLTYRGKLRTFYVRSLLTTRQLQILGESCPGLERLDVYLNKENMDGLSCLLSKHCRTLKTLDINLARQLDFEHGYDESYEILGADGWRALSQCIRRASNQLVEVFVHGDDFNHEPHYKEMVLFSLDVLEFLGERAREFCLDSQVNTDSLEEIYELTCRILNKCVAHSRKLRRLVLRIGRRWAVFQSQENKVLSCTKLLNEVKKLEKLPNLYEIDMGGKEKFAKKLLESIS